eukprot:1879918-Prymnesium_polylepis.1
MHPSRCLSGARTASSGQHTGRGSRRADVPAESAVSRVRTRRIGCRVVYAVRQGNCSPVRPMH